jgi:N-acetylmuramoyl-L-alanine amidase
MLSRRSVLFGAAGVAVVGPLAVTLDALAADEGSGGATGAPAGEAVPETLAKRRSGDGKRFMHDAAMPVTHVGLVYTGTAAALRVRTSAGWGEWRQAPSCAGGSDANAGKPVGSGLFAASGALAYEVQVAGGGTADVVELNTVDGPPRAIAAPAGPLPLPPTVSGGAAKQFRLPRYLSRPCWGADESWRLNEDGTVDTPPTFWPVQTLTVHHTGFDDDQPDPKATIRAIYYNQAVVMDWGDVGYQLFIDADGNVYEGTYSDPDPIPVYGPDLGADGRPLMVNGAHVGGFNAGNIGVVLLGDFTARKPTKKARRSLTLVLALLAEAGRLDPVGTTNYVNPISGVQATIDTIAGHRDWHFANPNAGATLCPGDTFYPDLPAIRQDVDDLVR